jgi:hypothetical protein
MEKMESPERIQQAREKFGLDKKEKKDKSGGAGNLTKPISLILRYVIQTQKMVRNIEKSLTKPSLKTGYTFDPRMAGGGRYKDAEGKIVAAKEAVAAQRTAALTGAIGADEEPLVKLREFLDDKFKDFDAKKWKQTLDDTIDSINGPGVRVIPLGVHDKLNLLLEAQGMDALRRGPGSRGRPGTPPGQPTPGKPNVPGKGGGILDKLGKVGKGIGKVGRVIGKVAAPLAIGLSAYDAYEGYNNAEQTLGMKEGEKATFGQKLAAGAGGVVSGLSFGLIKASTVGNFLSGRTETSPTDADLNKYVKIKDSGVNLDGLNPEMKKRLSGLAYEFFQKTGQKIQINSGYRDPKEQAQLYAKLGPPKAAPPGHSRHESGLAVDINSVDANKAVELGLMAKYGFTRPVKGEAWHIEPVETAKSGGSFADNPYAPGAPVAVANRGGAITLPSTGDKPPESLTSTEPPAAAAADPASTAPPAPPPPGSGLNPGADASMVASTEAPPNVMPAQNNPADPLSITATDTTAPTDAMSPLQITEELSPAAMPDLPDRPALTPVQYTAGIDTARQSSELATSQMLAQASPPAPVVINNSSGGGGAQRPIEGPKTPLPKASSRSSESTFGRALARDFSHPTAFTSVGLT